MRKILTLGIVGLSLMGCQKPTWERLPDKKTLVVYTYNYNGGMNATNYQNTEKTRYEYMIGEKRLDLKRIEIGYPVVEFYYQGDFKYLIY